MIFFWEHRGSLVALFECMLAENPSMCIVYCNQGYILLCVSIYCRAEELLAVDGAHCVNWLVIGVRGDT